MTVRSTLSSGIPASRVRQSPVSKAFPSQQVVRSAIAVSSARWARRCAVWERIVMESGAVMGRGSSAWLLPLRFRSRSSLTALASAGLACRRRLSPQGQRPVVAALDGRRQEPGRVLGVPLGQPGDLTLHSSQVEARKQVQRLLLWHPDIRHGLERLPLALGHGGVVPGEVGRRPAHHLPDLPLHLLARLGVPGAAVGDHRLPARRADRRGLLRRLRAGASSWATSLRPGR